ncbi:MAG TPA: tripartite tricarboxylate transporter substrate-binding protein [Steroidobacteraceae bacterium]|nr:tripartite tricarboxylate transporter substrate-binding protein [Steroidobacteraceae bacterium]
MERALSCCPAIAAHPGCGCAGRTPVTFLGYNTFFIVVHPSVPAKSIAELIAYAKANPKALNYAAGNTYALVATAMFATNNGITMHAVPWSRSWPSPRSGSLC